MDWLCPGFNEVLARQLKTFHGNLTAPLTISHIVPIVQTGDLHIAVYDHHNHQLYVANARGDGETGPAMAYDRCVKVGKFSTDRFISSVLYFSLVLLTWFIYTNPILTC